MHNNNRLSNPEQTPWESVVSEWMDGEGEIRAEDLDTPYGRQVWETYHIIGDVLRSNELAIKTSDMFYARLSRAIDEQPRLSSPVSNRSGRIRLVAGLSGMAAAALTGFLWFTDAPSMFSEPSSPVQMAESNTSVEDPSLNDYYNAHVALAGGVELNNSSLLAGVDN